MKKIKNEAKMNTVKNNSVMKKTMNEKMGMYRQKKRDDEERKKKEEEEKALEGKIETMRREIALVQITTKIATRVGAIGSLVTGITAVTTAVVTEMEDREIDSRITAQAKTAASHSLHQISQLPRIIRQIREDRTSQRTTSALRRMHFTKMHQSRMLTRLEDSLSQRRRKNQ